MFSRKLLRQFWILGGPKLLSSYAVENQLIQNYHVARKVHKPAFWACKLHLPHNIPLSHFLRSTTSGSGMCRNKNRLINLPRLAYYVNYLNHLDLKKIYTLRPDKHNFFVIYNLIMCFFVPFFRLLQIKRTLFLYSTC